MGQQYLEVVLRFRRLVPSLVESYVGPPELAARVDGMPPQTHADVAVAAMRLREAVERVEPDAARAQWLGAQLRAIEAACAWLAGAPTRTAS